MTIKRYKISFGVSTDEKLDTMWDSGKLVNLNEVLTAIQTIIDQLAYNPEWRSGAVLVYNAIAAEAKAKFPYDQCDKCGGKGGMHFGSCEYFERFQRDHSPAA